MWNKLFRERTNEVRAMNAAVISSNTHDMLRQMALPLIPQRRVKGALNTISRETGVSYSKLRKVYYRLTDHILAIEWSTISAAYARWLTEQERQLAADIEQVRALRAARSQGRLPLDVNPPDTSTVLAATEVDAGTY